MANTPISPKVTAGSAVAAIVGLLLQYSVTITPDTFAFLGKGQGLAFMVATLGAGALAAWWKSDPLRTVAAGSGETAQSEPATPASLASILPTATATPVTVESVPGIITVEPPAPSSGGAHVAP